MIGKPVLLVIVKVTFAFSLSMSFLFFFFGLVLGYDMWVSFYRSLIIFFIWLCIGGSLGIFLSINIDELREKIESYVAKSSNLKPNNSKSQPLKGGKVDINIGDDSLDDKNLSRKGNVNQPKGVVHAPVHQKSKETEKSTLEKKVSDTNSEVLADAVRTMIRK